MKHDSLDMKDLINIGVYTALYFVVMFATGMVIRAIPVLILFMPVFIGITCGAVYMLYVSKVKKQGVILIMACLIGITMSVISGIWPILIMSIFSGLLAEVLSAKRNHNSSNYLIAGYAAFNCWSLGAILSFWLLRDQLLGKIENMCGADYANFIESITPVWVAFVIIAITLAGGVLV